MTLDCAHDLLRRLWRLGVTGSTIVQLSSCDVDEACVSCEKMDRGYVRRVD